MQRAIRRRSDWLDVALAALTAFAILTQRSALGRADFAHQYFSAFLIGPMIVILLVLFGRAAGRVAAAVAAGFLHRAVGAGSIANSASTTSRIIGRVSASWLDRPDGDRDPASHRSGRFL